MQVRFLRFIVGLILIYIACLIVTMNYQPLFNGKIQGELKVIFEQRGDISLKDIQNWMGKICHVQKSAIDVYRHENRIEVIMPYRDGNSLNRLKLKEAMAYSGLPIRMVSSEVMVVAMNPNTRFLMYALLGMLSGGGLYFLYMSIKPNFYENQIKSRG